MRQLRLAIGLMVVTLLTSCATLSPHYEKPQVNITSFNVAPGPAGMTLQLLIGLQVVNPNRQSLSLRGMSYSVEVEEHRILSGAESDLPTVPGYGTADLTIRATPDLLGGARLINQMLSTQQSKLDYRFKARLDAGKLLPFINIEETGEVNLDGTTQR